MKRKDPFLAGLFFILSCLPWLCCLPSPLQGQTAPYENVYRLTVKVTHNSRECSLKKDHHHVWSGASALFESEIQEDWSCFDTPFWINIQEGEEGTSAFTGQFEIPLNNCLNYFPLIHEVDLESYDLVVTLSSRLPSFSGGSPVTGSTENLPGGNAESPHQYQPYVPNEPLRIPLREMLKHGYKTRTGCETIELSLVPVCKPEIMGTQTRFIGYPYTYVVKARAGCPEPYQSSSGIYFWEYLHPGLQEAVAFEGNASSVSFNLRKFPDISMGENVIIRLLNGEEINSQNTRVVCFYPQIPQPTRTITHLIAPGQAALDKLELRFDRQLNAEMEEVLTKITLYDSIAVDNGDGIPQSHVLYQMNVNITQLPSSLVLPVQLPRVMMIDEGRYHVSVEGTVRGRSNRAEDNAEIYPEEIRTAMFQVVPFLVKRNAVDLNEVVFTPPLCHGGKGSVRVSFNHTLTAPAFYWIKENGEKTKIPFRCIKQGNLSYPESTYYYDSLEPGMEQFEIRLPTFSSGGSIGSVFEGTSRKDVSAYFSIDFSQPGKIEIPVSKKDVSGYYGIDGILNPSKDGFVRVDTKQVPNGAPPCRAYYYDLEQSPFFRRPFQDDTLHSPGGGLYRIEVEDRNACREDTVVRVLNLEKRLRVRLRIEEEIRCHGQQEGALRAEVLDASSQQLVFRWYKNGILLPSAHSESLADAGAGTYRVELSCLETGMVSSDRIVLPEPDALSVEVSEFRDIYCHGEKEGYIVVKAEGGVPPYVFAWEDGGFGKKREYIGAGTHTVEVIDANGCRAKLSHTLTQPDSAFQMVIDTIVHAFYGPDGEWNPGAVVFHGQGGTRPYGPVRSHFSENPLSLDTGRYLFFQWDALHCPDEKEVEIRQIPPLEISLSQENRILCHGNAQASCSVSIEGGIAPYVVQWSHGAAGTYVENLQAGEYQVLAIDRVGARATARIRISEPPRLSAKKLFSRSPGYAGCMDGECGDSPEDGIIRLEVSGGTPPYRYHWKRDGSDLTGLQGPEAENLPGGFYQIDISDQNDCQIQIVETLRKIPALSAKIRIAQEISCHGESNGALQAEIQGGLPPYRIEWFRAGEGSLAETDFPDGESFWTPMGEDAFLADVPAGIYGLRVTDSGGVTAKALLSLKQKELLSIRLDSLHVPSYAGTINGQEPGIPPDGFIRARFEGGTPPYRYRWSDLPHLSGTDPQAERTGLEPGNYLLTVTDRKGCHADTVFALPETPVLRSRLALADSISCFGANDGALRAGIEGGTPPYAITWLFEGKPFEPGSDSMASGLEPGWYSLRAADKNGVESRDEVFLPQPDSLRLEIVSGNSPCHSDSSGFVEVFPKGGSAPYAFSWTIDRQEIPFSGSRLENLEKGIVAVRVTDKNACTDQKQAVLLPPEPLQILAKLQSPSYEGSLWGEKTEEANDGSILLEIQGGTPPYSILWNTGDTSLALSRLDSGRYRVSVQDRNGCTVSRAFRLDRTPALQARILEKQGIRCHDSATAVLSACIEGGKPPYRLQWLKDGAPFLSDTARNAPGLRAGVYHLQVWDANGVSSRDSLSLLEPAPIALQAEVSDATAWHFKNGSIRLSVQGGTPGYACHWNTGHTGSRLLGIGRGNYSVIVYDSHRCTQKASFQVSSPDSLLLLSHLVQKARKDSSDGSITLHIAGGLAPYAYQWTTAQGSLIAAEKTHAPVIRAGNLPAGLYGFSLTDSGGATLRSLFEVKTLESLSVSIFLLQEPRCPRQADAVLQGFAQGGTPPYVRSWEKWNTDSARFEACAGNDSVLGILPAGLYRFSVRDASLQEAADTLLVQDPPSMHVLGSLLHNPDLPEGFDGEVFIQVEGGKPPYRILWNDTLESDRILVEKSRTYRARITDANGCEAFYCPDTLFSANMRLAIRQTGFIDCHGGENAALEAEVSYGKPPFRFLWSNGDTASRTAGLSAGLYSVRVEDALGFVRESGVEVPEPRPMQVRATLQEPACHGESNGSIDLQAEGGSGLLQYFWNTGHEGSFIGNLAAGTYSVKIQDENRCRQTDTFLLREPALLKGMLEVEPVDCPGGTGRIRWWGEGGTEPYSYAWAFSPDSLASPDALPLAVPDLALAEAGFYRISVQDSQGCSWDTAIRLVSPPAIEYRLDSLLYLCQGQRLAIETRHEGTWENMDYIWTFPDGSTSFLSRIETVQEGLHTLVLVQDKKCLYRDSLYVKGFPDSIHAEFWVSSHIVSGQSCLLVNLSRYTPDSITWMLPPEAEIVEKAGNYVEVAFRDPGTYTLGMTSHKGLCSESVSKTVTVSDAKQEPMETETGKRAQWRVYPNPSRKECYLQVSSPAPLSARYRLVHALTGQCVEKGDLLLEAGEERRFPLFQSNPLAGLYILLIEQDNLKQSFKLIRL